MEDALLCGEKGCRGGEVGILLVISLAASLPSVFLLFSHVFVAATPDHYCRIPYNTSGLSVEDAKIAFIPNWSEDQRDQDKFSKCQIYQFDDQDHLGTNITNNSERKRIDCPIGWVYDKTYFSATLVTELNLVCGRKWLLSMSTSFFYLGSVIGNMIFGWASDRYGRKCIFFGMLLGEGILSLLTGLGGSELGVYTLLRFIRGLFFPAIYQIPLILCIEMVNIKWRVTVVMVLCSMSGLSSCLLALASHLTRHYQTLSVLLSLPALILAGFYWYVPESPRWLLSKGRTEEAYEVLDRIARMRHDRVRGQHQLQDYEKRADSNESNVEMAREEGLLDLMKRPVLVMRLVVLILNYSGCSIAYNALAYVAPQQLSIDPNLAFFINGIVEIPGYVIGWWLMEKLGRRSTMTICMILGGLSSLVTSILSTDIVLSRVMLAMLVKMLCGCGYTVLYVYMGELMPTTLRSTSTALVSFTSGTSLLLLPYLLQLDSNDESGGVVSLFVLGWLWLVSGFSSWLLLPETLHQSLPQTITQTHSLANQNPSHTPLLFNWMRMKNRSNTETSGKKNREIEETDGEEEEQPCKRDSQKSAL